MRPFVVALLFALPALAEPLTLPEAERLLAERGFDALAAQAAVAGAEGDVLSQGASANPSFNAGALYSLPVKAPDGTALFAPALGFQLGLGDNAAVWDAVTGKKFLRRDVAAAALKAARASRDDALRTLRLQLEQAFVAALLAGDNRRFAEEVEKTYAQSAALGKIRFDKGAIGAGEYARIATATLEARQAIASARSAETQARAALLVFLGPREGVELPEPRAALEYRADAAPAVATDADLKKLVDAAAARRPDLLAAQSTRQQKEAALTLARRQRWPDVALQATFGSQTNTTANPATVVSPPDFSLGVSLPLPVLYQQQGEVRRAESELAAARAAEGKSRAQVVTDVAGAAAALLAAREQVGRMEHELLAQAKIARDVEEELYTKGAASLLDYLDAERTWVAANLEHHQDVAQFWSALAQLRAATAEPEPLPLEAKATP